MKKTALMPQNAQLIFNALESLRLFDEATSLSITIAVCDALNTTDSRHFPTADNLRKHFFSYCRAQQIIALFKGNNIKELADQFEVSERTIRRIVNGS